jgi:hypothetical protein
MPPAEIWWFLDAKNPQPEVQDKERLYQLMKDAQSGKRSR